MKPFNLEAAKRGEPVCTSDGELLRFVAHVPEAIEEERVILIDRLGNIRFRKEDGKIPHCGDSGKLFMAPKKRTVWVNVYDRFTIGPFGTEGDADSADEKTYGSWATAKRLGDKAHPIEFEE